MPLDSATQHIVFADLKELLADMLEQAIDAADDIVLLARVGSLAEAEQIGRTVDVDAVVTGLERPEISPACRRLLLAHPRAKVLGVAETLGRTYMYVLRPVQIALGTLSPDELLQALRDPEPGACAS